MATLLERLGIQKRARVGKFDSQTIGAELGVYGMTASGITVSEQGALAISTVYACIYRIASTVSSLSLNIILSGFGILALSLLAIGSIFHERRRR